MTARPGAGWLYAFLAVQCVCVALLGVEELSGFRLVFRLLPFLLSIAYLALLPLGGVRYPLRTWAAVVLGLTSVGLIHPEANTLLAGFAQIGLSLAVWAPVFWGGRIAVTPDVLRRTFLYLWAFNAVSAGFGVLQVYAPDRFAPDPVFVRQLYGEGTEGLKIQLDDGSKVFRPMGLSDTPGGAALAANSAIVLGIAVALGSRSPLIKSAVAVGCVVAMFCLLLCQVRFLLILTVISVASMLALVAASGRARQAGYIALVAVVGAAGGFIWATSVGESAVLGRLETLSEGSAGEVYYSNRGIFVENTVLNVIPQYPFGAGLGRWGMMMYYFGDPNLPNSPPLWAEMTFTGWAYDGGLPLILVGYGAMLIALAFSIRIALTHANRDLSVAAVVVSAVSVAAFATTISAHVFVAQSGMIYLLLNAILFAATHYRQPAPVLR